MTPHKITKHTTHLLLFTLFFSWIFLSLPQPSTHAATVYGPFTFDSDNDSDEAAWTFVSDNGTNGLNTPDTRRAWCHDTNDTASTNIGPTSGQGGSPDGYVYTEASAPAAFNDTFHMTYNTTLDASSTDWRVEFYWNQRGNNNLATVKVQTNENGAGWIDRGTYGTGGPDVVSGGTQVWNYENLDLTGQISDSSTQIRFFVTFPSSGTSWHNDLGLDTITITGTEQATWPMTTNTNYTYDTNKIEFSSGQAQLKEITSSDWWNSSYPYRKKITFGTSHSTLPQHYTVSLPMDTRPANTNVSLTSGNDVRIVWQPDSGPDVELDRIGNTWNDASTNIEFRLQSEIASNQDEDTDGSYYVYYGYGAAGTPPTDEEDVYYFAENFNRSESSTVGNNWTEVESGGGTASISSNSLYLTGNNAGPPDALVKQNLPLGSITNDFTISWNWTIPTNSEGLWTNYLNLGASMSDAARETNVALGLYAGEGSWFSPNNNYNINSALNNNLESNINGNDDYLLDVDYSNKTFDYYRDSTLRSSSVPFLNSGTAISQIRLANDQYASGQPAFIFDDIKIVLDVDNPPEETLSTEEPQTYHATDGPTVRPNTSNGVPFTTVTSFSTEETLNGGSIRYQLTNNGTSASPNWYYWNGSNWVVATQATHYNDATTINTNIGQFVTDVGTGNISFKAFLISDGTQLVKLDGVNIVYTYVPTSTKQYIYTDGTKTLIYDDGVKVYREYQN